MNMRVGRLYRPVNRSLHRPLATPCGSTRVLYNTEREPFIQNVPGCLHQIYLCFKHSDPNIERWIVIRCTKAFWLYIIVPRVRHFDNNLSDLPLTLTTYLN